MASVAGLPDFPLTIGEFEIPDVVSNSTMLPQSLPFGIDIIAGRGCDFMLQDLVSALSEKGVLEEIKTGEHVN